MRRQQHPDSGHGKSSAKSSPNKKACLDKSQSASAHKMDTDADPSDKMKTAVTVLQEMMIKLGETPTYECISQSGPQHSATFEYRCIARGVTVTAAARSKKEAKQEVARVMLLTLAAQGETVPPPYGLPPATSQRTIGGSSTKVGTPSTLASHSYVALLKELCEEYRLPAVEFELVGDTGPPHLRHFTVCARLGQHERLATATTKKAARQQAAQQLYTYMRENLARITKDFVEEEALVRAHDRAMDRYVELREEVTWRPDLSLRVADYHTGLTSHLESKKRGLAKAILAEEEAADASEALERTAQALGLAVARSQLGALCLLELAPSSPALVFAGRCHAEAAATALRYLRLVIT